ncbi:MAG: hypothetical protein R6U67_00300 [Sodalinema sp.]
MTLVAIAFTGDRNFVLELTQNLTVMRGLPEGDRATVNVKNKVS